jgi:carboxymethylenebutenolidase
MRGFLASVGVVLLICTALGAEPSEKATPASQPASVIKFGEPIATDINPPQTVTCHAADHDVQALMITPKLPAGSPAPSHLSVILVHDIFGMTPFIKEQAKTLARQGYTVVVPNLYSRLEDSGMGVPPMNASTESTHHGQDAHSTTLDANTAWAAYDKTSDQQVIRDLSATIDYLQAEGQPTANCPMAIVGYDMGGIYAMMMAGTDLRITAAVNYYGRILYANTSGNRPTSPVETLFNLRAPLLSFYGAIDPQVPEAQIRSLQSRLANNPNKTFYEIIRYPHVGHGFMVPGRQGYDKDAAAQAAEKTKMFLARFLRAAPPKPEE